MTQQIDVVFDGPPGPEAGRFIEVEDMSGESIRIGQWVERTDGYWVLRISVSDDGPGDSDVQAGAGVGLAEATRRLMRIHDERQTEHVRHGEEIKRLDERISKAEADRDLVLGGMTLDVVELAETVIEVKGRENVGKGDGRAAVSAAIRDLAVGAPALRNIVIATKRYDRWDGQREDHAYGYGPRHGSIIFSIGLRERFRDRPGNGSTSVPGPEATLTEAEKDAAIAYLHAVLGTLARP